MELTKKYSYPYLAHWVKMALRISFSRS